MPAGQDIYRIARDTFMSLGMWRLGIIAQAFRKDLAGIPSEQDPFLAAQNMASKFIPYIDGYIDMGGRFALASLGQQPADDWLVNAPEVLQAARTATLDLCEETIQKFLSGTEAEIARVRDDLGDSLDAGETARETVNRVAKWMKPEARWRARRIAVTESARAFNHGQLASTEELDFVVGYRWVLDGDACPMCHAIQRQCPVIPKGGTFAENGNNQTYKQIRMPPLHPNCVLGETPIRASSIISATHAKYHGPIVRIECSDGSCFSVTANHMLLTPTGFARAADLMEGDDVIRTSTTPESFSVPSFDGPNENDRPATADEIFRSLSESGRVTTTRMPVSAENLHGDARFVDGNIDIVRPDSLLWRYFDSFMSQPFDHISFVGRTNDTLQFNRLGGLHSLLNTLRLATDGGMGRLRELKAILWASVRHTNKHGFGSVPLSDANLMQSANNQWSSDVERLRKTLDGLPGLVTTAKVTKVNIFTPQDPVSVYDFETAESMYIIDNGIVSSNCRCTVVAVLDDEMPESWPQMVRPDPLTGYITPEPQDFERAKEGGYESVSIGNAS